MCNSRARTAIIPYAQGIGFAIPVNAAKYCSREIILYGAVRRPWLGIIGLNMTEKVADYYDLPVNKGVLVVNIASGSPVDKASIRKGDIILEFDNKKVDRIEDLQSVLKERKPGDRAELTILRGSKTGRLELMLERMP